jgi:acyl dehydratase
VRRSRALQLTPELLRAYSRGGNFHSDADEARRLGLPGLVAQGMQLTGPAYGLALDEWGDDFLDHGELELKFTAMVTDGQTVDATIELEADGSEAGVEVRVRPTDRVAVVGCFHRTAR